MTYRNAWTACPYHAETPGRPVSGCAQCLGESFNTLCDMLDSQHEATQALNTLVHAHQENLIERVYALEGGDAANVEPWNTGHTPTHIHHPMVDPADHPGQMS
jgi:hypothetical protein